jgi:hypothetical protein
MRIPNTLKLAGLALMTAFTSSCKDISITPKSAPTSPPSNPGWRVTADTPEHTAPSLQDFDTQGQSKKPTHTKPSDP